MDRDLSETSAISTRVYQFAQLVYKEFEKLYNVCGESACATLLSLNLKILEELEHCSAERKELVATLNAQLAEKKEILFQLEREKKLHKTATMRMNSVEDELMAYKKSADDKLDKLESLLRHRDLLAKNAHDHASRLEERITQTQAELTSVHERYNELLKAYVDQVERSKLTDTRSKFAAENDPIVKTTGATIGAIDAPCIGSQPTPVSDESYQLISTREPALGQSDRVPSFIDLLDNDTMDFESVIAPNSEWDPEKEEEDVIEPGDFTEDSVMMKEVSKLIQENQDLSATKNALNVVKNDLIRRLDDVTGEKLMLSKETEYLRHHRDQCKNEASRLLRQLTEYQTYVAHLQTRLRLYEEVEEFSPGGSGLHHAVSCAVLNEVPTCPTVASLKSSRALGGSLDQLAAVTPQHIPSKRMSSSAITRTSGVQTVAHGTSKQPPDNGQPCFTHREVARLVAERNQYKQNFLELQDSVRYTASLRATLTDSPDTAEYANNQHISRTRSPGFGELFFNGLRSMADDLASGMHHFLTELEPVLLPDAPSEALCITYNGTEKPPETTVRSRRSSGMSSNLRRMFGHLLGHAAGQGAEAVLGTGNAFAADVASQSFTSAILDTPELIPTVAAPSSLVPTHIQNSTAR